MNIHGGVTEESKGSFINGLREHVCDHLMGADEIGSEDKQQHGSLKHFEAALVVSSASGCAVLLDRGEVGFVITEHRGRAGDSAIVVGEQISHKDGSFSSFRSDGGFGLMGGGGDDLKTRGVPVDGTVVVHDDIPAHGARVSTPGAVMCAVEPAGL